MTGTRPDLPGLPPAAPVAPTGAAPAPAAAPTPQAPQPPPFAPPPLGDGLLAAVLDRSIDGVLAFDRDCRYTFWNAAMERISGVPREQAVGARAFDLFPFLVETGEDACFRRALAGETVVTADRPYRVASTGREGSFEGHYSPLYAGGKIVGGVAVVRDMTQRKLAGEAAGTSRRELEDFVENASVGLHWVGPDGTILWANRAELEMLGYARGEYVGRHIAEFHADPPVIEDILRRLTGGEVLRGYEARLRRKDGSVRHVQIDSSVYREGGRFVHTRCFTRDVTEQKRVEDAVREAYAASRLSEARYRNLVEQSPLSVQTFTPDGSIRGVNRAWEQLFGVTAADLPGYNVLRDEQLAERGILPLVRRAFEGEPVVIPPIRYVPDRGRYQGRELWCGAVAYPVKDAAGRVEEVVLVHDDVTAQREAAEKLSLYREIFAHSNDGIGIIDPRGGHYVEQNAAHAALTGYADDEIRGRTPALHLGEETFGRIGAALASHGTWRGEAVSHTKSGEDVPVEVSAFTVRDAAGDPVCFVGVKRDIRRQKRAEAEREQLLAAERAARAEAERANRVKDDFLATLSHELRTPLNAILGWCQLLRGGTVGPDEAGEGLEVIERNARVQAEIVSDLLDMTRIVSGKLQLDVRPVDVAGVIAAAVATVRASAEAKGLHLLADVPADAGEPAALVMGDGSRLQQVLWNLLSNAIKFTPPGGVVRVSLRRATGRARVTVSDTGPGIKPEFLPFLFERFRQADTSSTRQHGGLGLGLAIVKSLVEMHGGTVRAESPAHARGATFAITLPLAAPSQAGAPGGTEQDDLPRPGGHPPVRVGASTLRGVRVLVVDDEADALELVRRLLEASGAEVATAGSAAEALDLAPRFAPAVLVTDIGMPGMDGYGLLRRARALESTGAGTSGRIPAVALTAFARREDRDRAMAAGFDAHVTKPADAAELVAAVARLVQGQGTMNRNDEPERGTSEGVP